MEKSNLKSCNYCLKPRVDYLFFHTKDNQEICNICYPHYVRGKQLDQKTRKWIGYRKPINKARQRIYQEMWYRQHREEERVNARQRYYQNLSTV